VSPVSAAAGLGPPRPPIPGFIAQQGQRWGIVLADDDGRSIRFGLDGVRATDRERLIGIVSHYMDETMAEEIGPVDEVLTLNPWFPASRSVGAES
jgi:hypothetical protein